MPLTPKQRRILAFIADYTAEHAAAPEAGDIVAGLKLSPVAVASGVQALMRKGRVSHRGRHMQGGLVVKRGAR